MRFIPIWSVCCLALCLPPAASASTVQVIVAVDDPILSVGQVTTLHVSAEITDGAQDDNGIWAYALDVLLDQSAVIGMNSVEQLGAPELSFSSPGYIDGTGLHNVYGGDGGFFSDKDRGIGTPYETLAIEIVGLAIGKATISASPAEVAAFLGIVGGFLLQGYEPGLTVDFGNPASVTVVPEPATLLLWLGCGTLMAARRRKREL